MHNIAPSHLHTETHSRGQREKGVVVLARKLTCHSIATCCYGIKEPLGEPRQEEKPGGEWVHSITTEKKTLVYPPWPLCHPSILFTPREVFSLIDPPVPSSSPRALETFTGTPLVLCVLSHPFLSLSRSLLFYRLYQERCSPSIANWLWHWTFITWWLGVFMGEMWERAGACWVEECGLILRVIIMIWHFVSVTGGDYCTRVSQRSRLKTSTHYKDNWLISH